MVKRVVLLILVCFLSCGFSSNNNTNVNHIDNNTSYKIFQKKINLLPVFPYAILGLNSYLYKDVNGVEYLIIVAPKIKNYSWLIDSIKFDKQHFSNNDNTNLVDISSNLYLKETLELQFNIKILNTNITKNNSSNVDLPYFIIINNKKTNNSYVLKDKTINLNLVNGKTFVATEEIKVFFKEDDLNNLEILVGFKQSHKEFNNLKTYIYNKSVKNS